MATMNASTSKEVGSKKLDKILESQQNLLENIDELMAEGIIENEDCDN